VRTTDLYKETHMKRRIVILAGVLVTIGWLGLAMGSAQQPPAGAKEPNASPQKGKEGGAAAISLLNQASELVRYARENESPLAMLTAVQMLQRVRLQEDAERVGSKTTDLLEKGERVKEGKKGQTAAPTLDPQELLAEAKPWAQRDPNMRALIEAEAAKPKPAAGATLGRWEGPIRHRDRVLARHRDDYVMTFRAGQVARVGVVGDGDTDLDLYIYDENGNLITKDDDGTAECLVAFTPRWTGKFRVRIVNRGNVFSEYILMTN
jgi:hypothetical protein